MSAGFFRRLLRGTWALLVLAAVLPRPAAAELVDVLPRIKASVVAVGTWQAGRNPAFQFRGTGFVVGDGHLVATNAHVVAGDKEAATAGWAVIVTDGKTGTLRQATRVAVNADHDLALLRIGGAALPALAIDGREDVSEGQAIAFTGFPLGNALGLAPVTHRGIISAITPIGRPQAHARQLNSALIRRLESGVFNIYQLDATAYPGNSGSPMFHPDSGEVLGIINMVFVKGTKESALTNPSGISYAIPARYLKELVDQTE